MARCVRACQLNETEQSLVADGGSWNLWIQQETDRRVKLLSFAFLNLQSIAFGTPPAILADEINVRLPCSSLEWIAPNEQKWRLARRPGHREQMSFQDALRNVIKNTPDINSTDTLPIPSPLSNYIILHAIIQRILLAYHTLGPYNDANNIILNGQKNVIRYVIYYVFKNHLCRSANLFTFLLVILFMHGHLHGNEPLNRVWTPAIRMAL